MSAATPGVSSARIAHTRCVALFIAAVLAIAVGWVAFASSAHAEFTIHSFTATPSTTQAGGHPDVYFEFENDYHGEEGYAESHPCLCNDPKNVEVHLPTGFIGNPHATPQCNSADFAREVCPSDSQVGMVGIAVELAPGFLLHCTDCIPLYNLVPKPTQAGLLAWKVPLFNTPVYTVLSARTGSDYGLDAVVEGVEHVFALAGYSQELWGVPADSSHNADRCGPAGSELHCGLPSNSPPIPFLQNPTVCNTSLSTTLRILAYNGDSDTVESPWPEMTGCDQLGFNPSLSAQPTTSQTDSASGLEVDLSVPQVLSPYTPSGSEIRETTVELPPGFSINPNAADGKTSCSDEQARFHSTEEAQCPEYSKIGTVTLDSSALPAPLPGGIYIGEPQPGNRYRIFLTANGFATHIKLAGSVRPNPSTGQITVSFEDLPQSPLTAFNMHFFGSERGLLATPTQCGTYAVHSTFTPWDELLPSQTATQFFKLESGPGGSGCPGSTRPFHPGFVGASVNNGAGVQTPFSIDLTRQDGEQNLGALSVSTPRGLLATLKGIPYCSDAALAVAAAPTYTGLAEEASPSCPSASQVGVSYTAAGAGDHPVYLTGKVYLAGPYKGAPLSLAVITPAVSGPYDLGDVVVRTALNVDPTTAQITAASDPLPIILEGIPLRLRRILINLNRSGFTRNPTDCEPSAVTAQVTGNQGAVSNASSPFQVANCASLPFQPTLKLSFSGGMHRAKNPAVKAVVTAKPGEANIARTVVTMPHTELIDNAHIKNPCTRVQFAANQCPPSSIIGVARAETPLLERPLEGPVYMRSSSHKLPDIVAALKGQIDITLDGRVSTVHERIRTTFATVPDAPVTRFVLRLDGGKKGLLQNSANLCEMRPHAIEGIVGQSGKRVDRRAARITVPCGKHAKRRLRHRKRGRLLRARKVG